LQLLDWELDGRYSQSGPFAIEKNLLPWPEIERGFLDPSANSLVSTPTEL
jgi:hypothetical protein